MVIRRQSQFSIESAWHWHTNINNYSRRLPPASSQTDHFYETKKRTLLKKYEIIEMSPQLSRRFQWICHWERFKMRRPRPTWPLNNWIAILAILESIFFGFEVIHVHCMKRFQLIRVGRKRTRAIRWIEEWDRAHLHTFAYGFFFRVFEKWTLLKKMRVIRRQWWISDWNWFDWFFRAGK